MANTTVKSSQALRIPYPLAEKIGEVATLSRRSLQNQVALFAEIGLQASSYLSMQDMTDLIVGRRKIALVANASPMPSAKTIAARAQSGGKIRTKIKVTRYIASKEFPGLIQEVKPSGESRLGRFNQGKFIPEDAT